MSSLGPEDLRSEQQRAWISVARAGGTVPLRTSGFYNWRFRKETLVAPWKIFCAEMCLTGMPS